ncbi:MULTISPECIES: GNAT family N-acetyltransferase [unclassified Gordonia (in: high G+C Gram-positive bacteria)]
MGGVQLHRRWSTDVDPTTLYGILRLRVDVFVVEQSCPYPELDGRDLELTTRHLWVSDEDGTVVATLRLLEDEPSADDTPLFRIGRVCTARGHRGEGLAARLLETALAEVGEHPCRIEAQSYLTEMYAQFGFVVDSDEYLEDGIPHVSMLRVGPRAHPELP